MKSRSAGSQDPAATPLTSRRIKDQARALGFDLCGVAACDSFPELSFLREWLDLGYAGEMGWLAESVEVRSDARRVLPGARSVIMTGTLYNTDRPYSGELPAAAGRVSRHAWGDDYHRVLWARHNRLVDWMRETSPEPFETSALVDSGPVQERVYAQYAGLGWVGKNTCLINPELGSWLFLGEIITTLALEPDAQGLEQCGTCTRCLEACPSGALVEPGVLDARRCLSYLTIEVRGSIPGGDARGGRHPRLRLRHLPGGVPVQPAGAGLDGSRVAGAHGVRAGGPGVVVAGGRRGAAPRDHRRADAAREARRAAPQSRRGDRQQRRPGVRWRRSTAARPIARRSPTRWCRNTSSGHAAKAVRSR